MDIILVEMLYKVYLDIFVRSALCIILGAENRSVKYSCVWVLIREINTLNVSIVKSS